MSITGGMEEGGGGTPSEKHLELFPFFGLPPIVGKTHRGRLCYFQACCANLVPVYAQKTFSLHCPAKLGI